MHFLKNSSSLKGQMFVNKGMRGRRGGTFFEWMIRMFVKSPFKIDFYLVIIEFLGFSGKVVPYFKDLTA
jgi:hypothetical protein